MTQCETNWKKNLYDKFDNVWLRESERCNGKVSLYVG